jgi:histidinol-phosphate aminotransferase
MSDAPRKPEPTRPQPKTGILEIAAYTPGKAKAQGVANPIKMSANENPLGCSPLAMAAFAAAAQRLSLYPDGKAMELRAAVAKAYNIEPERLIFGCGSDEVFEDICQAYLEPGDNVIQGEYGFAAYAIFARACQAEVRFADMPDMRLDVDTILSLVDERTKILFIDNPGNPTGTILRADEIARLHANLPGNVILVLDGAYAEFVADPAFNDGIELARFSDNVVVTHTFSKLGLASARVGWGYAPAPMIEAMERIRQPFNLTIAGMEAAVAMLGDVDFIKASVDLVVRWRPWLVQQLGGLGLDVVPSEANFVLVRLASTRAAAEAEAYLASRGLLVRYTATYGLPDCLRITIGLEEHNRALIEALRDFLAL